MRHLPRATAPLTVLVLTLGTGLSACSGGGDNDDDGRGGCTPGDGRVTRALVDDRAALPVGSWVPVVSTRGGFRGRLAALDEVSRAISADDVRAVAAAGDGAERRTALDQAVSDVPGERGARLGRFRVVAQEEPDGDAVARLWAAGLERLGARTRVDTAAASEALAALGGREADVAVLGLADLAAEVGAELEGGDASSQVQAVAQAALEDDLALGATSSASTTPQVLAPEELVSAEQLTTLGELAEACADATIAATEGAEDAAGAVAEAYGFELADEPVASPEEAFGTEGSAVVAVVTGG